MTVGHIPTVGNDRKTFRTFNFGKLSRTTIAVAQMIGDGLVLTMLSYLSLILVIYLYHETVIYAYHETIHLEYLPYVLPTVSTTIIIIFYFARSGVYDVFCDPKR